MSGPAPTDPQLYFWARVERQDDGCWLWTGPITRGPRGGYGECRLRSGRMVAHRMAYEMFVGPVPDGLQLDHLCRNRRCVNPDHLEPVTCRENLLRGDTLAAAKAAQTHCVHGHEFTAANTGWSRGYRKCRTCDRLRHRASYRAEKDMSEGIEFTGAAA